jgi:hypothetical protein
VRPRGRSHASADCPSPRVRENSVVKQLDRKL